MIVEPYAIEGNGDRPSHRGNGFRKGEMYTLNTTETHCVAYTLKMRGGADTYMKSDGKIGTAGKGALIQIEKSATLSTMQDQVLFQPIKVVNSSGNDICGTIDSHYYLGCGCRGGNDS